VELLLRDGKITESEIQNHPMANFVECCLGGDPAISGNDGMDARFYSPGDILLLCTDGVWRICRIRHRRSYPPQGRSAGTPDGALRVALEQLGRRAVQASAPYSDNSTVAALRWVGL